MRLVEALADEESVGRITMGTIMKPLNFEARGLTQSGVFQYEPYSAAGLDGEGQVVGSGDSGLNDLSCFFFDDANGELITRRSEITWEPVSHRVQIDKSRRKVIQYNYALASDQIDMEKGHGTHVVGSILGNCDGNPSMNGMAPAAKVSFWDMGMGDSAGLSTYPSVHAMMEAAYLADARVHSNSWGGGYEYDYMCESSDQFQYDHPDMLILYAAGNDGSAGPQSILSPAISKNSVSVGAMTVRNPENGEDQLISQKTVSYFSSQGPHGGRYAVDIAAPGEYILSAYSGNPANLSEAIEKNIGRMQERAVISMMGTSMATPVAAGNVLLIRQFFMDPVFWSRVCNYHDAFCRPFVPSAALLKAVLLNSGENAERYSVPSNDAYTSVASHLLGAAPDNYQGFGAIRLSNILTLDNGEGMNPNKALFVYDNIQLFAYEMVKFTVEISESAAEKGLDLKATIAWMDKPFPASSVSDNHLIHNLDLIITHPDGTSGPIYFGNRNGEGGDSVNPVEQVLISAPIAGVYSIYIRSLMLDGGQNVSLALTYPTNSYPMSKDHRSVIGPIALGEHIDDKYFDDFNIAEPMPPSPDNSQPAPVPTPAPPEMPSTWKEYTLNVPFGTTLGPDFSVASVGTFEARGLVVKVRYEAWDDQEYNIYQKGTSVLIKGPDGKQIQAGGSTSDYCYMDENVFTTFAWSGAWSPFNVHTMGADMYAPSLGQFEVSLVYSPGWSASEYWTPVLSTYSSFQIYAQSNIKVWVDEGAHDPTVPTLAPTFHPNAFPSDPPSGTSGGKTPRQYCSKPRKQRIDFSEAHVSFDMSLRNGELFLSGLDERFYPLVRKLALTFIHRDGHGVKTNTHATKMYIASTRPDSVSEFHAKFRIVENVWEHPPQEIRIKFMGDIMIGPPQMINGHLTWPDGSIAKPGTEKVPSHNHLLGCVLISLHSNSTM